MVSLFKKDAGRDVPTTELVEVDEAIDGIVAAQLIGFTAGQALVGSTDETILAPV
jgi:hypothetical protein